MSLTLKFNTMRLAISLIIYLITVSAVVAQGIHFTANRELPIHLNPAFTGNIPSGYKFRVIAAHRRQANTVLGRNEFETYYASGDYKLEFCNGIFEGHSMGLGFDIIKDHAGLLSGDDTQFFETIEANFNGSLAFTPNEEFGILAGFRLGYLNYGLADDNLIFDNQFNGRGFGGEGFENIEDFGSEQISYFDLGAGFIIKGYLDDFAYEFGMSMLHLNNKREKYLSNSNIVDLPREFRVHGKVGGTFSNDLGYSFSLIFYKHDYLFGKGKQWQLRPTMELALKSRLRIGPGLRISNRAGDGINVEATTLTIKYKPNTGDERKTYMIFHNIVLGASIDFNFTPYLTPASKAFGGFEIFIAHYFGKMDKPCCPWSKRKHRNIGFW